MPQYALASALGEGGHNVATHHGRPHRGAASHGVHPYEYEYQAFYIKVQLDALRATC